MADTGAIQHAVARQSQGGLLSLVQQQKIAEQLGCSLREVENHALEHSILPARFKRNSLSCDEQLRLFQSRISIIGCGGLGGRTAELLARLGIGHLILTDPDSFSESNLNRQSFCTTETLGQNKVDVIAGELKKINPVLEITRNIEPFKEHSIAGADIIIDGLDSTEARIELAALCQIHDIPLVHGAVKEWYGQAGVERVGNPLINTLYSLKSGKETSPPRVMVMNVALIAAIQAAETCKLLLGHHSPLTNGWLQTDLLYCEYETLIINNSRNE